MARRKRNLVDDKTSFYHLISRSINGLPIFGEPEKKFFRETLQQVTEFSGIQVLTYAIMEDHFHLLVEIPSFDENISDAEIVRRFQSLYPVPTPPQPLSVEEFKKLLKTKNPEGLEIRDRLCRRMGDPSSFMKSLKQRFSQWFNRTHERYGPLWNSRFESVLVEDDPWALMVVAAYIDLNPVRAEVVDDPADYLYSGFGASKKGDKFAQNGQKRLSEDLGKYAQILYGSESDRNETESREELARRLDEGDGKISVSKALRCRIRYFTDGMVIGYPKFVEEQVKAVAVNPKRERRAHPMRGADWQGLAVGTGLHMELFR